MALPRWQWHAPRVCRAAAPLCARARQRGACGRRGASQRGGYGQRLARRAGGQTPLPAGLMLIADPWQCQPTVSETRAPPACRPRLAPLIPCGSTTARVTLLARVAARGVWLVFHVVGPLVFSCVCTELTADVYCPNLCTQHRVLDFIISDHSHQTSHS